MNEVNEVTLYTRVLVGAPVVYERRKEDGSKINVVIGTVNRLSDNGDRIIELDIDGEKLRKLHNMTDGTKIVIKDCKDG